MNKNFQVRLFALMLALSASTRLYGQSWVGASGGSWGNAANWSPATVPNAVGAVASFNSAVNVDVQNTGSGGAFPYTFGTLSAALSGNVVIGDPGNSAEQLTAQVASGVPTFSITSGATLWFYFVLNGTQGFNKTGGGTLTFRYNSQTQPYTGNVTISGGALGLNVDANLGNANNGIIFSNNAQLYFNPTTASSVTLANSRNITLSCSAANIAVANTNYSLTIPGVISESAAGQGLQKTDVGTLVLSGANTYSGATKISTGTLGVSANNNLGGPAASLLFDGAVLQITGSGMTNFGHTVGFTSGKAVVLDIDDANNIFTADQALNQGSGGLTKWGPGTLALSQANTYTGTTAVNEGTLKLVSSGSLAAGSSVNLADGTTLDVSSLSGYTLGSSATMTVSSSGAAATIKGGSGAVINFSTRPITLNYNLLNPALVISSGNLALSGQTITVNTAQPLGNGTYNLVQVNSGNLVHAGTYNVAGNATNGASGRAISFATNAGIAYVQLIITGSTNSTAFLGGSGLRGDYFNSLGFTNLVVSRADATVDFNWGASPPVAGLGANYSVRWTGQVVPLYSENYTFQVAASTGARLWVNDKLLTTRTAAMPGAETISGTINLVTGRSYNLMLEYLCNTNNARVQLAWSSASQPWQVVPQAQLAAVPLATADAGTIQEEYWLGLTGTNLTALTSNGNYPNHPAGRELLLAFESLAPNWTTNLGTRVSGWLLPLTNGNYQFAVAAADTAQLWLSTDAATNNKVVIASVPSATSVRQFNAFASQQSVAIPLIGGKKYFIELLQKASTNASHFSVAWQPPGASGFAVIPGDYLAPNGLHTTQPGAAHLFDTLATAHPRLMTSPERFAWLRQCIASNSPAYVITAWQNLSNSAAGILSSNFFSYDPAGTAGAGQAIWDRVQKLGTVYFVTGKTNFAERAWLEMSNACTFAAWWGSSNDGLGMGEMNLGMGLGYDWFYDYLTPARRNVITNGMVTLGMRPAQNQYPGAWYVQNTANNWAMVFNSGSSALAMSLANELPTASQNLLSAALTSMRPVMGHFSTDNGGYYEGSEYWDYGVAHLNMMLAGVESSLGTLFSLDDTPGYDDTALFEIYNTGPTKQGFNYSDSFAGNIAGGGLTWLSRRFNRPVAAWWKHSLSSGGVQELLWYDGRDTNSMGRSGYAPDNYFRGPTATTSPVFNTADVSTARTKWDDANASFIAFKTGALDNPHGHLDAGSFVFDALGRRWIADLGTGNYSEPGYFDAVQRWWVYRCRAEGHNTLVLNPQLNTNYDQVLDGRPAILFNSSDPDGDQSVNIADLTPAYAFTNQAPSRVWRGTKLFNNRTWLLVQDEIISPTGQNVWWFSHFASSGTTWGVSADGSSVTLTNSGNRLWFKLLSGGGSLTISNATLLPTSPPQTGAFDDNTGYRKVALHLANVTNTTIAMLIVPLLPGDSPPQNFPAIVPLANWATNDFGLLTNTPPVAQTGNATATNNAFYPFDLQSVTSDLETPDSQLRFTISQVSTGSVALLADGHTVKFTPPTNYVGLATLNYTANDKWMDPRLLFYYDFQAGNWTNSAQPNDLSGHWHDGTFDTVGTGVYSSAPTAPAALASFLAQSARLVNTGTNGARLSRGVSTAECNFSESDWTFSGWFRRETKTSLDYIFYIGDGNGLSGTGDELELFCQNNSGDLILQHYNNGNTLDFGITASGVVTTGVWNQVVVTFTRTNSNSGLVRLYFNGLPVGSAAVTNWSLTQNLPVRFGAHADATSSQDRWFDGELDELAMFKAALTATEISSLTNHTIAHFGGATAANQVSFNVVSPLLPPVLLPITNRTIIGGAVLVVASQASDPNVPALPLQFRLPTAPAGATVNSTSGVVNWRPSVALGGTSNQFMIVVTNTASLAATQSFWVGVIAPQKPWLTTPNYISRQFGLTINGDVGPDYTIQATTNLPVSAAWTTLLVTNPALLPFNWAETNTAAYPSRYYRVLIGP